MVVRDDFKAEVAEALQPIADRLVDAAQLAARASAETNNINERLLAQEQMSTREVDRVGPLAPAIRCL